MRSSRLIRADQLTELEWKAWEAIQQATRFLSSPYFRPEFVRSVAAVRDDVEIAILNDDGLPTVFFPFQRGRGGIGRPVGVPLSDFQAVIARPETEWSVEELLHAAELRSWKFDHILTDQQQFAPYHHNGGISPFIDLSGGFEAYRKRVHTDAIPQTLRKIRKFEREVAPLRFEFETRDAEVLKRLRQWKSQQYRDTGFADIFRLRWTNELLERLLEAEGPEFSGMLSALYAGDTLIAAHFGMRCRDLLHWWFPAYDREYRKLSPGYVLLVMILQNCEGLGLRRIDLGLGSEEFKTSLMTGGIPVAEGTAGHPILADRLQKGWRRLRNSSWMFPARLAANWTRGLRQRIAFH